MNANELIQLSIDMSEAYCRRDLSNVYSFLDERCVFVGPREGQLIEKKENLLNSRVDDSSNMNFGLSDIQAKAYTVDNHVTIVLLHYTAMVTIPKKGTIRQSQTTQFTWVKCTPYQVLDKEYNYKTMFLQIANPKQKDERDLVYNAFGDIPQDENYRMNIPDVMLHTDVLIPGLKGRLYRYPASNILWIESSAESHHSIIHTRVLLVESTKPVTYFEKTYPGLFMHPHSSYLVNPAYIKAIERFQITLWNDERLPVPERKYTAFKDEFLRHFKEK